MRQLGIRGCLVSAAVCLLACCAGAGAQDDVSPADIDQAIDAIARAETAQEASKVYASLAGKAPKSVELRDVYMRKLLVLGVPDMASSPARSLSTLDSDNGIAWALVAYYEGKRGQVAKALPAGIEAGERVSLDANTLYNLGQMAAWVDLDEDAKVDQELVARMKRDSRAWRQASTFMDGYERVKSGYEQQKALIAEQQAIIDESTASIEEKAKAYDEVLSELGEVQANIAELSKHVRVSKRKYEDGRTQTTYRAYLAIFRALEAEQKREGELYREKKSLEGGVGALKSKRKKAERQIDKIDRDKAKNFRKINAQFEFKPPAHDAEAIALDVENLPPEVVEEPATAPAEDPDDGEGDMVADGSTADDAADGDGADGDGDEGDDGEGDTASAEDEAAAAKLMKKADLFLEHEMVDRARDVLEDIVEKYPDTAVAERARALLQGLQ